MQVKSPAFAKATAGRQKSKVKTGTATLGQGVFYFHGDDAWAAREAIAELVRERGARLRFIDREELERDTGTLGMSSSLFGRLVLVVRDPSELPADVQQRVIAAWSLHGAMGVLWDRGKPDRRSMLFRHFRPVAREFTLPDDQTLTRWLVTAGRTRGVEVSSSAAAALIAGIGRDRWQLSQELDKAAVTGQLAEVFAAGGDADVFAVLAALVRGERDRVLQGVQQLLGAGHSEFYILAMLAYQFRTLFLVRSGLDAGLQQLEIVRRARVKSYAVQKNLAPAQRRSALFWLEALTRVLATDTAIRSGVVEARTGLLMLVSGLVQ